MANGGITPTIPITTHIGVTRTTPGQGAPWKRILSVTNRRRKDNERLLKYGFFEDFEGSDAILFDGRAEDLGRLASVFDQVASGALTDTVILDASTGFRPTRDTLVTLTSSPGPSDQISVRRDGGRTVADWIIHPANAAGYAQLVRNVAEHRNPGHEYLGDFTKPQIIVARDEYGEEFFNH